MEDHVIELLDRAGDAVHQAQQHLYTQRSTPSFTIPDLYPIIGNVVELSRVICEFLETVPDLTEFKPSEHYDSQGRFPRETMASAEFALRDARGSAEELENALNRAWSHIGRLGLKDAS